MYMGWRHERISGKEYFNFIDLFIQGIKARWPDVLLQFEDFSQGNATPLLKKYQHEICCFNDDIQGTAAVTVGTLLAACHANNASITDQRVVFIGGGSAGCGIAEQIVAHMVKDGLSEKQALSRIYLFTHLGLLTSNTEPLLDFQEKFARDPNEVSSWANNGNTISLLDLVRETKPTILIGVSGQPGLMTEEIIKTMYANCNQPVVLPLSNPTSHVEAIPEDIINWTEGNAIVATGSPFTPVEYQGTQYVIVQCNNSYIFPGVGLGVIGSRATRITEKMFMVASEALAECSPLVNVTGKNLLPALSEIREVSLAIALAVGLQAMEEGVAPAVSNEELKKQIQANFWSPEYREYRRKL